MDAECRVKRTNLQGEKQEPVAFLTCNFSGPIGANPALLSHQEVVTLFHEFGHGLHHMLTKIEVALYLESTEFVGMPWNFLLSLWRTIVGKGGLVLISGHNETQEPLPADVYKNL